MFIFLNRISHFFVKIPSWLILRCKNYLSESAERKTWAVEVKKKLFSFLIDFSGSSPIYNYYKKVHTFFMRMR